MFSKLALPIFNTRLVLASQVAYQAAFLGSLARKSRFPFQSNFLQLVKITSVDFAGIKNGLTNEGRFLLLNPNNKNR
jgi:hypothetical protein